MSDRSPEVLRVLSWAGGWGRALRSAVAEPFERLAGVRVEQVRHVGLKLPEELLGALERGEPPPVDVVWSNAVPALRARAVGHCAPLDPSDLPGDLRRRAFPAGGGDPTVVYPYVVYYVLAYHEAACPEGPPPSWRTLLDPRYRRKVALYPGGNGFYPIAQRMGGGRISDIPEVMQPCWSFVSRLAHQICELDYSVGMEERIRDRKIDLCFRALPNAIAFRAAGVPVSWCVPREGATDTVDALWIPSGLPKKTQSLARRFITYALRREVQERWCSELGVMPVHSSAKISEILKDRRDLPEDADDYRGILHISEETKVEYEPSWERTFQQSLEGALE